MADLLSNLDSHIKDIVEWDDCNGHYHYNTMEQVTPDDAMSCLKENSGFWKSYAASIDSSTKYPLTCTYVILNKPPQHRIRMPISYSATVQKVTARNSKQSKKLDATTAASTISGTSKSFPVFECINKLKKKLAEIDVEPSMHYTG
jgi:hypothetical protein